ncbi:hypothetical protein GQ602_001477 [Ophiocordyceps camponoti-floridani]|uniref:Uncharacterized protein n=1 Tax=Ophiocordyceps camponoti-floridani TaxID=2030778 RepID=A0A8H4QE52_9HYPO|nr:hypothetical protein GQ602_001477 [Ophiocordyceps camponoti-floridani]
MEAMDLGLILTSISLKKSPAGSRLKQRSELCSSTSAELTTYAPAEIRATSGKEISTRVKDTTDYLFIAFRFVLSLLRPIPFLVAAWRRSATAQSAVVSPQRRAWRVKNAEPRRSRSKTGRRREELSQR